MNKIEQRIREAMDIASDQYEDQAEAAARVCIDLMKEAWRAGFVRCMVEDQREEHEPSIDDPVFPKDAYEYIKSKL